MPLGSRHAVLGSKGSDEEGNISDDKDMSNKREITIIMGIIGKMKPKRIRNRLLG